MAAAGGVLGVLLGILCVAPAVTAMISYYNVPVTRIVVSPANICTGILMPVVFIGIAGFWVTRGELKKTAAELMKGDDQKSKVNFLERSIKLGLLLRYR